MKKIVRNEKYFLETQKIQKPLKFNPFMKLSHSKPAHHYTLTFKTLNKNGIPYFIRVKQNTLLPWGDQPIQVGQLFNHLNGYQCRLIEKEMYGSAVLFVETRSLSGDSVFKKGLIILQFLLTQSVTIAMQTIQATLQRLQNANF